MQDLYNIEVKHSLQAGKYDKSYSQPVLAKRGEIYEIFICIRFI